MKTTMKKRIVIAILSVTAMVTALFTGCGCNTHNTSTPDEAVPTTITTVSEGADYTVPTLSDTDKAIVDEGLKVDDKGNITDSKGNKVEVKEDGTVEVKTQSGETVRVKADDIKTANVNNQKVEEATQRANNSSSSVSSNSSFKSNNSSSSASGNTSSNSNSSQTNNKPASSSVQNSNKPTNNSSSNNSQSSVSDPHAGKTYHEAVYKTVNHPAETKVVNHPAKTEKVKIVDKDAYTYEEPVYETVAMNVCNDCGADVTNATIRKEHMLYEIKNGGKGSYKCIHKKIQTGTKTVTVPEEYHYETKVVKEAWTETVVVKEAWTEKVLVKEAGWY